MKSTVPSLALLLGVLTLRAQPAPRPWMVALLSEREHEGRFRTGETRNGNIWETEFSPMRRTGIELGWWPEGRAFRPSLAFGSGHAPQGSHSHASLHVEWGTPGPFLVQGGFLLIRQTHGPRSEAGYGGRLQLGWVFAQRIAVVAYGGLTSMFKAQSPGSSDPDFPGGFAGVKVAVRF